MVINFLVGSLFKAVMFSFITFSNGDVRVNWAPVTKSGTTLKTGDTVSVSGKGRLKVAC